MSRTPPAKAASRLARRVEEEILRRGWPAGTSLGSEAELLARHGVSRTVFREAVRLLEHDGICAMRRGPGGGLFVTTPDADAVTHAATLLLRWRSTPLEQLYAARELLEARCAVWAAERLDEHGASRLRDALAHEASAAASGDVAAYNAAVLGFHTTLAELSGNDVCALFVRVLVELNASLAAAPGYQPAEVADTARAHAAIAEAVIAHDPALAGHRAISHMRASHEFASRLRRDA